MSRKCLAHRVTNCATCARRQRNQNDTSIWDASSGSALVLSDYGSSPSSNDYSSSSNDSGGGCGSSSSGD